MKGYNYGTPGAYFITICIKNRKNILGKIVGCGDFDAPRMVLSEYGKTLDKYINLMNAKHSHIKIEKYIIMPNHLHLIINIADYSIKENGASETAAPYNREIPKFISLLKRYCNKEYGDNIWQRSYHDHIIRGEDDYWKIWDYVENNVFRWKEDCFYEE